MNRTGITPLEEVRPDVKEVEATSRWTLRIPASAATHEGFRAWATSDDFPRRGRFAYIDGEIHIDMSPEELETHVKVKTAVATGFDQIVKELDLGESFGAGALVSNVEAGVSNEPDATFVRWEAYESGRVTLTPRKDHPGQYMEIVGTPDVVVEVVSLGTVSKDTKLLRSAYHRAGIPEFWLIDARDRDEVRFQILRHTPEGYRETEPEDGWRRSRVFGRRFRLERGRNRAGRWEYTLRSEPA